MGTNIDTTVIAATNTKPTTMTNAIIATTVVARLTAEAGRPRLAPHVCVCAVPPRVDATAHLLGARIVSSPLLLIHINPTDGRANRHVKIKREIETDRTAPAGVIIIITTIFYMKIKSR